MNRDIGPKTKINFNFKPMFYKICVRPKHPTQESFNEPAKYKKEY